jgi:hypothetical protein
VEFGNYTAAGMLARALPMVVAPMLTVLFTSRSAHRNVSVLREQLTLLGLYAVGLAVGATGLLVMKEFGVRMIFGAYTPASAAMIGRLALAMVFVGLLQALGTWALASRWFKLSLGYGFAGLVYWLTLLIWGKSPTIMLRLMPLGASLAFALLFVFWIITLREHHATQQDEVRNAA